MYYRFSGAFIESSTFEEAQEIFIKRIKSEKEDSKNWYRCTCLGLSHEFNCPENPYNKGEIPY